MVHNELGHHLTNIFQVGAVGGSQVSAVDSSYPMITIAIPTYNRASLVKNRVANALAQSYQNIEVLVSDNASPDDTLAILKSVNDERLRVLTSPENVGANENHAKCVREVTGLH